MKEREELRVFKESTSLWLIFFAAIILLVFASYDGIVKMVQVWSVQEEYGYGYMIPFIVAFFIWQKKNELASIEFTGSFAGLVVIILGGGCLLLGDLATLFIVTQYAALIILFGIILSFTGWRAFKVILPALCLLIFMIPLPNFLYQGLSAELQLISSQLGVAVIRLFGISVFLAGNVIDLGTFKLQVVEACSGLRYLFPLAALAYMSAYLYKGEIWKKILLFVSSAPITVLMNSFRIGVIGILVEYWGIGQAKGFLHDFEGWFVFMACMMMLMLEMWILSNIGRIKTPLADVFELTMPAKMNGPMEERRLSMPMLSIVPLMFVIASIPFFLGSREEIIPSRLEFNDFPMQIAEWQGTRDTMEQQYIDILKFDDYIMANYIDGADMVQLYVAYYKSQRKGASIHSPRSCIPGGGWKIVQHDVQDFVLNDGSPMSVNRLLIQKGSDRQLVYYWFDQRGRDLTNEYVVKWYLFWDALTKNRTDGALVRVVTALSPGESLKSADKLLKKFIGDSGEEIKKYIPE